MYDSIRTSDVCIDFASYHIAPLAGFGLSLGMKPNMTPWSRVQEYIAAQVNQVPVKLTDFRPGCLICVETKFTEEVKDKDKKTVIRERVHKFTGRCVGRRGAGINATFKVHSMMDGGIGVSKVFSDYEPNMEVSVLARGKVRRAKLNYYVAALGKKEYRIKDLKEKRVQAG